MNETIISVAIIGAIATLLVNVIRELFKRNTNKKDEQDFILQLVSSNKEQSDILQSINYTLGQNNAELRAINDKISTLSVRVDKLESKVYKEEESD